MASVAVLRFVVSNFDGKKCLWDIDISPCTKFRANVSHSDQVAAIKRNFRMAPATMLDFLRSEIRKYLFPGRQF